MTFPNIISTVDLLFATFGFVFMAWPLLLLAPLQGRGRYLPQMIVMWIVCAGIRVFIAFDPKPLFPSLFIHEPLNTILFAVAGVILIVSYFGLRARQRGRVQQKKHKPERH